MNDLIFRQVRILDGSGSPEWMGDVSVRDGRINEVGTVTEGLVSGGREIVGNGAVLSPGLIDTHAHDDGAFFPTSGHGVQAVTRRHHSGQRQLRVFGDPSGPHQGLSGRQRWHFGRSGR